LKLPSLINGGVIDCEKLVCEQYFNFQTGIVKVMKNGGFDDATFSIVIFAMITIMNVLKPIVLKE